jgi:glycosyltransferase involved in cell wall biosynthesis
VRSAVLVVPGRLDTRTGGYIYDRRIVEGLRARGWSIDVRELDASFPQPLALARDHAARVFAGIPSGTVTVVDSLALGVIPDILASHAGRLRIVALVHLPLVADVGLDPEAAARIEVTERRALEAAVLVVVTGKATVRLLARYRLPPGRVVVVEPGTDRAPLARGSKGPPVRLLCVATLNPGKGHEDLIVALAAVTYRDWHLTCAGSLTRHPPTVARVRAAVRRLDLDDRVSLVGEFDGPALEASYDRADLFVLATQQETYGMAVAEALAHGLPVVSTTTGAIPDLVDDDAGLLVTPGDTKALTAALSGVLGDADLRSQYAEGARRVRERLATWDQAAVNMAAALESIGHG